MQAVKHEVETLLAREVDRLIFVLTQSAKHVPLFQDLQKRKIPFVLVGDPLPQLAVNFVGADNIAVGKLATEHLLKNGCRWVWFAETPYVVKSAASE
jgi:LacI family transcriptional regulator